MFWITYSIITLFNICLMKYRYNSTNKQVIKKLEENGYICDIRYKHSITRQIPSYFDDDSEYDDIVYGLNVLSFIPLFNIFPFFINVHRITGHHNFMDWIYDEIIDDCLNQSILDDLITNESIHKNNKEIIEKKQVKIDPDDLTLNDLYNLRNTLNYMIEERENIKKPIQKSKK